ncbi:sterol desaturase family protein [Larkinella arboricola]|uniref:Fatty acid hydroxylase family protein n=1 Tax=Larkinella arboricola TaxID=643671 RepID=A0A327WPY8_LARAB|nr:sterol desaturase family protein [Larkinella arboricola]RAJ92542.1 fatty acid hydroxylase family protein [Larkinella arboricola]
MAKNYVSNSQESIRMFKSDFLEVFSKVHFWVPLVIYIPLIFFLIYQGLFVAGLTIWQFLGLFAAGLFIWTLTEYVLHRFVFHYEPQNEIGRRLHFIFHGVHHDYPNDAKRLVMPPSASIPLAALFYFLFDWLLPATYNYGFFTGFISGYLVYDMTHYAIHHYNFKSSFMKNVKKHHMLHHYSDPEHGYGVSSDLWDRVFQSGFKK